MKINTEITALNKQAGNCLILGIYADKELTSTAQKINELSKGYLLKILKKMHFHAKKGELLTLFDIPNTNFTHVILIGCGKKNKITAPIYKDIVTAATKAVVNQKAERVTSYLSEIDMVKNDLAWKVKQQVEAISDAAYRFDEFKSHKDPIRLKEFMIHLTNDKEQKVCKNGLQQGLAIAHGVALAKDLGNMPSNICTPSYLAKQAQALARAYPHVKTKILDEKEMQKLGMGAILAVTKGSAEPAKLIVMEYNNAKKQAPVALVGKGITFDTGGNSIKPADSMVGMKYDMCGAASVLGTIKACAELKLATHVVGVIAAVENMPGGSAYKPEDILVSMSGKTIEVISTDAEGRLVLADAITYSKRYKPDVVIDIATLTGAVVIALGFHATGLVGNDQTLADDLLSAGVKSNDRAWQLPLWDEYQEQIKSPFADISNTGGRAAGAITAGCFLSRFADGLKWAHLDVAGTAAMMMGNAERRATGRPIPLLMQFLIDRVNA